MSVSEFKEKMNLSVYIVKKYRLYFFLGLLVLIRTAPHLDEPIDYYLTEQLNFSSTDMTMKNAVINLSVVIGIFMIKKNVFNYYNKTSLVILNTLLIISSVMLLFVTNAITRIPADDRFALAYLSPAILHFALDSTKFIMFNIYITFCPKNIEATFATFYFFIDDIGRIIGLILQNFLVFWFNISKDNENFGNIIYLIATNIAIYLFVYVLYCMFIVPTATEVHESVILDQEDLADLKMDDSELMEQNNLLKSKNTTYGFRLY